MANNVKMDIPEKIRYGWLSAQWLQNSVWGERQNGRDTQETAMGTPVSSMTIKTDNGYNQAQNNIYYMNSFLLCLKPVLFWDMLMILDSCQYPADRHDAVHISHRMFRMPLPGSW